ncbi:MAG: hypothetical protein M5U09_20080 [Gammaproteobacteria bacterium]|nr:hypothetical protein [Gammaproteobacteria bacterium]
MRLTQNQLALIADIYDAAIRPSQWVELLDRLVPEVGAKGSALLSIEALGQYHYSISETSSLYSSEVKSTYEREYSRFEESHFANVARSEPRTLVFDEERSRDPESFFRRKDVSYLRETCGVYERFAVKLNDDPARFDCLTFQYDKSRGNIGEGRSGTGCSPTFLTLRRPCRCQSRSRC